MKKVFGLYFLSGLLAMSVAAANEMPSDDAVYVKVDYMQLTDSTPLEYFELELGEWRPVHAQRIRQGVTMAWYFYEMMPGVRRDDDQPYDYITVSVFDSYDKIDGDAATQTIFEVYPGIDLQEMYDRADEARSYVRSDIWRLEGTAAEVPWGKPAAPYFLFRFLKEAGEDAGAWGPVYGERIRRGDLKNAVHYRLANPEDEPRPYTHGVIEYFDGLRDILVPVDETVVGAARSDLAPEDVAALIAEREAGAGVYKSQVFRLIDSIDRESLDRD